MLTFTEQKLKKVLSKISEDLLGGASDLFHKIEEIDPTIDLTKVTVDDLWLVMTDVGVEKLEMEQK